MKREKLSLETVSRPGISKTGEDRQVQQRVVGTRGRAVVQVEVRRKRGKAAEQQVTATEPKIGLDEQVDARRKALAAAIHENEAVVDAEKKLKLDLEKEQLEKAAQEQQALEEKAKVEVLAAKKQKEAEPSSLEVEPIVEPEPSRLVEASPKKRFTTQKATTAAKEKLSVKEEEENKKKALAQENRKHARKSDLIRLALMGDEEEELKPRPKAKPKVQAKKPKKVVPKLPIFEGITVQELAERMATKVNVILSKLQQLGLKATTETKLECDSASVVALESGFQPVEVKRKTIEEILNIPSDLPLEERPPVVTVMGHIDHGKTTLLDALRHVSVASTEFGGITQHIGAYQIIKGKHKITMIDTPGHAAFTAMRSMGVQVTDIVVLVVAADESIRQQTIEAIELTRSAGLPMIVAVSKCDRVGAEPERVYSELAEQGVYVEPLGGEVLCSEIVAPQGKGIADLVSKIMLQAELLELKASPKAPAQAVTLETAASKNFGTTGTFIVKQGTLSIRDTVVIGNQRLRIKMMIDDFGRKVNCVLPGQPVQITGLGYAPEVGEMLYAVNNEEQARELLDHYSHSQIEQEDEEVEPLKLAELFEQQTQENKLNLIIKADKQGMLTAIVSALEILKNDNGKLQIAYQGVGPVSESDVTRAEAINAKIIAFNVTTDKQAKLKIKASGGEVTLHCYKIIYKLIEDCEKMLYEASLPKYVRERQGIAQVLKVFELKKSKIAGCSLKEGNVTANMMAYLVRADQLIGQGRVISLRQQTTKLNNFRAKGEEFGVTLSNLDSYQAGDQLYFC